MKNIFHSKEIREIFEYFKSEERGLDEKEAQKRIESYGENEITEEGGISSFFIFLRQFKSALVYILLAATLISAFFGKWIDVYVILAIIFLNAVMGFIQEYKAEKAIKSLREMIVPRAKVYREGELKEIPAKELVPGDIISLEEGDRIPADVRFFYIRDLRTTEASLTGESTPVSKSIKRLEKETGLGDRLNMGYMGTFIAGGKGKGVVVATGDNTAFGQIAKDISSIKKTKDHFEEKSSTLAKQMAIFAFTSSLVIFFLALFRFGIGFDQMIKLTSDFQEVFLFGIAALVSGIPEGLPAILVIVLAIGANRMAKRNAIIRKLPSTETLGVATHIVTDKTGTLTQNTMTIRNIILPEEEKIEISGEGWEFKGDFLQNNNIISPLERENLKKLLHISAICNNARITKNEKTNVIGDPTEASLVVLAKKAGLEDQIINSLEEKIDDNPFNAELKYRASLITLLEQKNKKEVYVVGAPEAVLERSKFILTKDGKKKLTDKKRLFKETDKLTNQAMRTLALAYREVSEEKKEVTDDDAKDLVLVGIVGMIDPPRPEVKEAVKKAKTAGIKVIMTTGDHKGTALAIAKKVGIVEENKVYEEKDLKKMNKKEFEKAVKEVSVFARLTPHMKLKIAEELQRQGAIVAMTGDGVNDAPALKKADIGIAMGIEGTDVAKEASGIVLADDNFASIINAVEEGRIVFRNTRQTSATLISTNFAEHVTIISSLIFFGGYLPLLPTQILWLNLITDGFAGAPLASEPGHDEVLKEKPRDKKEGILTKEVIPVLILTAIVMAIITLLTFNYYRQFSIEKARTAAFSVLAFTQLFRALNMRDMKRSVFKIGFFKNKYLIGAILIALVIQVMVIRIPFFQNIFEFKTISFLEMFVLILISSSIFWFGEAYKFIVEKKLFLR